MDKEERIRELASDMDYGCTKRDLYPDDAKEIAKALDILGYRKIVWHKVADGDLPKYPTFYVCHYKGVHINSGEPYEATHEMYWNGKRFITDSTNKVIAWTELPKYKE